jgi:hypothetical protein
MAENKKESWFKAFFSKIVSFLFRKRTVDCDKEDSSLTNEEIVFYDTIDDD